MAHFARLDENNIVTMVTVVSNDDMIDENGNEIEALGVAVCEAVVGAGPWVQTSYNHNARGRYAGIGYTYDANADVFIRPKPEAFPSWVLNDQYDWEPPVPKPEGDYGWNEDSLTWVEVPTEEPEP
jgi:hypothetical protein